TKSTTISKPKPPKDLGDDDGPLPSNKKGANDAGRVIMELEMLSQAKKSLASNPRQALAYTDQHAREFPDSQLTEQRVEIRVKALCALGRGDEARKEAAAYKKKKKASAKIDAALGTCR